MGHLLEDRMLPASRTASRFLPFWRGQEHPAPFCHEGIKARRQGPLNVRERGRSHMAKTYTVAVVGATGAVGEQMLKNLEERSFPVGELRPLASARSAGKSVRLRGEEAVVRDATPDAFEGVDIALFSAGEHGR